MAGRASWLMALMLACAPLCAASLDEVEKLFAQRRFYDATAQATALIDARKLAGVELGRAHLLRGKSLRHRWQPAAAFADFQAAHDLLPDDADAAYWLGYAHAHGFSGRQDADLAQTLLQKAADGGIADADFQIAYLQRQSPDHGIQFLERAASKNVALALSTLGRLYAYAEPPLQNPARAVEQYRRSATLGDADGQYLLGRAYCDGMGVDRDLGACRSWIERSAAQGNAQAHLTLGNLLEQQAQARIVQHHYWLAGEGGVAGGMINIGLAYMRGHGVAQDWREALTWFHRAQGVPMADYYAALMYLYGMGVEPNDAEARKMLERASQHMPQAAALLAGMYAGGMGTPENDARAEALLTQALESTDPGALNSSAWTLATAPRAELRQPAMALRLARQSVALAATWPHIDTLAAAYAAQGDYESAAAEQKRALQLAPESERAHMQGRLASYRQGRAWMEPLMERAEPWRGEPRRQHVATFIGEVVQLWQGWPSPQQPGYAIGGDASFALRIVIESVVQGTLPKSMQESAVFYVHSPTQFFAPLKEQVPAFSGPQGPRRYVLTEVEAGGWQFDLTVEPLSGERAPSSL